MSDSAEILIDDRFIILRIKANGKDYIKLTDKEAKELANGLHQASSRLTQIEIEKYGGIYGEHRTN